MVEDVAPPPGATSAPHYARPHWQAPVYVFAERGQFRPASVSAAGRCAPAGGAGALPVPADCWAGGPPPALEVAGRADGGALRVCATAALGPPALGPGAPATGLPVTVDLSACGPVGLLRFRLLPPVAGKEFSFTLDDFALCADGDGAGGAAGAAGVRAPQGSVQLPVVDPGHYPR